MLKRTASVFEEVRHHAPNVILAAKEHRQDADRPTRFVNLEPVDRPVDGHMPQAGQDVVMAFAPRRRRQDSLRGGTNLQDPRASVSSASMSIR